MRRGFHQRIRALHRLAAQFFGGVLHRFHDVLVARATAQITGHPVPDFFFGRTRIFLQQPIRARDHAGRTKAALQAVFLHEAFLQRMQFAALRKTFDGQQFRAVGLYREHRAGLHRHAIDIDRAGAAVGRVATNVRSGMQAFFTQCVNQQFARFDHHIGVLAVQFERHHHFFTHYVFSNASSGQATQRACAVRNARCVISPAIAVLYATSPRKSAAGSQMLMARRAASEMVLSSSVLPRK